MANAAGAGAKASKAAPNPTNKETPLKRKRSDDQYKPMRGFRRPKRPDQQPVIPPTKRERPSELGAAISHNHSSASSNTSQAEPDHRRASTTPEFNPFPVQVLGNYSFGIPQGEPCLQEFSGCELILKIWRDTRIVSRSTMHWVVSMYHKSVYCEDFPPIPKTDYPILALACIMSAMKVVDDKRAPPPDWCIGYYSRYKQHMQDQAALPSVDKERLARLEFRVDIMSLFVDQQPYAHDQGIESDLFEFLCCKLPLAYTLLEQLDALRAPSSIRLKCQEIVKSDAFLFCPEMAILDPRVVGATVIVFAAQSLQCPIATDWPTVLKVTECDINAVVELLHRWGLGNAYGGYERDLHRRSKRLYSHIENSRFTPRHKSGSWVFADRNSPSANSDRAQSDDKGLFATQLSSDQKRESSSLHSSGGASSLFADKDWVISTTASTHSDKVSWLFAHMDLPTTSTNVDHIHSDKTKVYDTHPQSALKRQSSAHESGSRDSSTSWLFAGMDSPTTFTIVGRAHSDNTGDTQPKSDLKRQGSDHSSASWLFADMDSRTTSTTADPKSDLKRRSPAHESAARDSSASWLFADMDSQTAFTVVDPKSDLKRDSSDHESAARDSSASWLFAGMDSPTTSTTVHRTHSDNTELFDTQPKSDLKRPVSGYDGSQHSSASWLFADMESPTTSTTVECPHSDDTDLRRAQPNAGLKRKSSSVDFRSSSLWLFGDMEYPTTYPKADCAHSDITAASIDLSSAFAPQGERKRHRQHSNTSFSGRNRSEYNTADSNFSEKDA